MRILLLCDHKWRDLPGLAYLKIILEKDFGHRAVIAPIIYWDEYIYGFRPHLVVLNHSNGPRNRRIAREAKNQGMAVCIIPTEGFPNHCEIAQVFAGKFTDLSCIDLYFVWNKVMRQTMIEEQTLPADKIVISGVPRFDFYAPPLNKIISTRKKFCEDYRLNPEMPLITWATNFPLAKFADWKQDFIRQELKDMGFLNLKSFPGTDYVIQQQRQARIFALETMTRVIKSLPGVNFVIKPHPVEDILIYKKFIDNIGENRVVLVLNRYIWDVVKASDLHLYHRCVTAAEAWLFGKPTIEMKLTDGDYWFSDELARGSDLVTDEKALFDRIRYYLSGGEISSQFLKIREEFISKWFYNIDGNRTIKCAKVINAFLESNKPKPNFLRMNNLRVTARLGIRHAFSIPYHQSVRFWAKRQENGNLIDNYGHHDKTIQPDDVKTWVNKIKKFL
jgi:surface carbohydrate biosynthesis protein